MSSEEVMRIMNLSVVGVFLTTSVAVPRGGCCLPCLVLMALDCYAGNGNEKKNRQSFNGYSGLLMVDELTSLREMMMKR